MTERIKGETVEPVNTLKLMESIGVSRAARMLGVSTTTLFKARKNKLVSRVIEEASTGKVSALGEVLSSPPTKRDKALTVLFLLEVPAEKKSLVEQFAKMLDANLMVS